MIQILKWIVRFLVWMAVGIIINKILFFNILDMETTARNIQIAQDIKGVNTNNLILFFSVICSLIISWPNSSKTTFFNKIVAYIVPFLYFLFFILYNKIILLFNLMFSITISTADIQSPNFISIFLMLYVVYAIFIFPAFIFSGVKTH